MASFEFYDRLAIEKPRLAVKYMAHLAHQIQDGPSSAKSQALYARIDGDTEGVVRACDRADNLRAKLLSTAEPFFDRHGIIGDYGISGQARAIFDVLDRNPVNRDHLTRQADS